jgi:hypothetical protein
MTSGVCANNTREEKYPSIFNLIHLFTPSNRGIDASFFQICILRKKVLFLFSIYLSFFL